MSKIIDRYNQFYKWWTHPGLHINTRSDEFAWVLLISHLASMISSLFLTFLGWWFDYQYACFGGGIGLLFSSFLIISLRYSKQIMLIVWLTVLESFIIHFLVSYGDGGIWTPYAVYFPYFIWIGFYIGQRDGIVTTLLLFTWLSIWVFVEYKGFEFPNSLPSESSYFFQVSMVFSTLHLLASFFWLRSKSDERIRKKLEDSKELLIKQEKMASLGQLTAGVAHEINNPINFITSGVQVLKMDLDELRNQKQSPNEPQTDTQYELLEEMQLMVASIEEGASRTATIIQSLRLFAIENNEAFAPAYIYQAIDSTLDLLKHKIPKGVSVIKKYEDIPMINCQISRLNQVIMNVLDNAIFAVGEVGNIDLSTKIHEGNVVVSITDNGSGMTEETLSKIFDPFFTTKKVGQGTGLGMSISYGIIKDHGGNIEVLSEDGKGTEVVIKLMNE